MSCVERGHHWKLNLNGWVCSRCKTMVLLNPNISYDKQVKPDQWLNLREVSDVTNLHL